MILRNMILRSGKEADNYRNIGNFSEKRLKSVKNCKKSSSNHNNFRHFGCDYYDLFSLLRTSKYLLYYDISLTMYMPI